MVVRGVDGADDVLGTVVVTGGADVVAGVLGTEVVAGGCGVGSSSRSRVGGVSRPPPPFAAEERPGPVLPAVEGEFAALPDDGAVAVGCRGSVDVVTGGGDVTVPATSVRGRVG
ncbi:hypothetical protein, partial [Rhodococcoides corynebacterioides]|uniref:hypothetical protein n=1 Tax=Rhodococcoides corynebacterioides TaxID=53972 RepID=UPI001C9AB582